MNTKNYLFLLSISPVQSFIAEARKTHDLYAGSQILSELTQIGMTKFVESSGTVIFPNAQNESKPNRFLGKIEADAKDLPSIGNNIDKSIREHFENLGKKALEKVEKNKELADIEEQFYKQINNHLEISWLFEEIKDDNYQKAYSNIGTHLEAIKNTKGFKQFSETGRKCSIDGKNNALFFGKKRPSLAIKNQRSVVVHSSLKEKEGLSAVSFTKRFYEPKQKQNFPSTAEIALMHTESQLKEDILQDLADFKEIFTTSMVGFYIKKNTKISVQRQDAKVEDWIYEKYFDYQLLYQENFDRDVIHSKQLEYAKPLFDKLKPYFKDKYYALLAFDGDKMGNMLSGDLLKDKSNTNLESYQTDLSALLSEYATFAKEELSKEKQNGKSVYAGGDDFLGFVNLHHLSSVLTLLRTKFEVSVNKELQKKYPLKEDFTFSAGVAIAHYKTPLDIVLKTAKQMEHKAKAEEEGNRNAFAIAVLKHSGDTHATVFKWGEKFENLKHINAIIDSLESDFSSKWIQNLDTEFALFAQEEKRYRIQTNHRELVKEEMKRLIGRSCNLSGNEKIDKVKDIYQKTEQLLSKSDDNDYNFRNFIQMLHIARFIRKELKN